jgi:hypothetical protein
MIVIKRSPEYSKGRHRAKDYDSSVQGAKSVSYRAGSQKAKLLSAFQESGKHGLTDDEAAVITGLEKSCFWKRCGELRSANLIYDTGTTRKGPLFGEQRMISVAKEA